MNNTNFYLQLQQQLPLQPQIDNAGDYLASAVILPLVEEEGEIHILFEVRAETLTRQPGEICFPGGRMERGELPMAAAVRETAEELNVRQEAVNVLGPLPIVASPIGVLLYPYVAMVTGAIQPSKGEVAECFTVPLSFLLDVEPVVAQMEIATRPHGNFPSGLLPEGYSPDWKRRAEYPVWFYHYQHRVIWGLTARVLYTFIEACRRL